MVSPDLQVDFEEAARFLGVLAAGESNPVFVFQTFTDDTSFKEKLDPLAQVRIGSLADHAEWIQQMCSRGAGVFVQINHGAGRGKESITGIRALFCDVDGTPIKPIVAEMPKPHILVSSSPRKYHLYWLTYNCSPATFGQHQLQLAERFGTDASVRNLDRVLRLPGTWHQKDPQRPYLVHCITNLSHGRYSTMELMPVGPPPTRPSGSSKSKSAPVSAPPVTGNPFGLNIGPKFKLPDVLPEGNRTTHLISYIGQLVAQGHTDEEWLRNEVKRVMLERLPQGQRPIPDETLEAEIYGYITKLIPSSTPTGHIPPSSPAPAPIQSDVPVLARPVADEDGIGAMLPAGTEILPPIGVETFLDRYLYVEDGQRVVDLQVPKSFAVYRLDEFHAAQKPQRRGQTFISKRWLEHIGRKTVRDIVFYPGKEDIFEMDGTSFFNSYEGADLPAVTLDENKIEPFLAHAEYMIPDIKIRNLFYDWLAFALQFPDVRIQWAPLIVSKPGVGKGLLFQILERIFGEHNCSSIGPDDLSERKSTHNEWISGKLLVCIDEMYTAQKWEAMERLKPMMTEKRILVNHKYGKKGLEHIFAKFIAFSNHITQAAALSPHDRRWLVWHVEADKRPPEYYEMLLEWLNKTTGPAHLLAWLQARDVRKFQPGKAPPMTEAKERMISDAAGPIDLCLMDAIQDKEGAFSRDIIDIDIAERYVMRTLSLDRITYTDRVCIRRVLADIGPPLPAAESKYRVKYGAINRRVRCYCVRNYDHWRMVSSEEVATEYIEALKISLGKPATEKVTELQGRQ